MVPEAGPADHGRLDRPPCRVEHPDAIHALRTTSKAPSGRSEIVTVLGTCPAALTSRTVDDRFHSTSMVPSSALVPTWLSLMSTDAAAIGAPASSSTRSVYGVRTSSSDQPAHKAQTMVSAASKRNWERRATERPRLLVHQPLNGKPFARLSQQR